MEQGPPKEPVGIPLFRVIWHPEIKRDFSKIPPAFVDSIVRSADYRLSRAPQLIGQPLKGTTNQLWRIAFSKYRVVYAINAKKKEVWVLSVQKRELVYRDRHVQYLLKLAVAIQEEINRGFLKGMKVGPFREKRERKLS